MLIACISASRIPSTTANSIQAMKVCQSLAQLGNQVRLLAPADGLGQDSSPSWEQLAGPYGLQTPFEMEWLPARLRYRRYDFALAAVQRARALQAELVYAWPLQAAIAGLLAGFPVLLELHGEPEGRFGPRLFSLFLRLPGKKRFLSITRALAIHLERRYRNPFRAGQLVIAPNGVDLDRYDNLPGPAAARRTLGLPETFTAAYSGHLYPGRGMGMLVELARRFPSIQFLWIGGNPQAVENWRSRLAAEGIANISLPGFVENSRLPLYQAAAEVLLMPYERIITGSSGGNSAAFASPMKMFEYMACERAIITSNLPVIGEVLNGENAILCEPEDAGQWEQALRRLQRDLASREELGRRARQDVAGYTWLNRARRALEGFPQKV